MSSGWVKLHRSILEDPVWTTATPEQKAVLMTVLLSASHEPRQWAWEGKKFEVQPGQFVTSLSNLATKAGVSIQSVRSAIARFEKLDFLANESTKTGRLISIRKWSTYQDTADTPNKEASKDPTKTQQLSRMKEGKKENLSSKKSMPSDFMEFWKAYPKHQKRQDALKAWAKLSPEPDLQETILNALEKQKATDQWQKSGGQFIPHASTWLNGRRWEDEISSAGQLPEAPVTNPQHQEAALNTARAYGLQ